MDAIWQGYRGGSGAGAGAALPWPMTLAPTVVPRLCVPSDSPLQHACPLISQGLQAIRRCPHGSVSACAVAAMLDCLMRFVQSDRALATPLRATSSAWRRNSLCPGLCMGALGSCMQAVLLGTSPQGRRIALVAACAAARLLQQHGQPLPVGLCQHLQRRRMFYDPPPL